jgi:hypothetical protein
MTKGACMFKTLIFCAVYCASLPLFAQQAGQLRSIEDFNKSTGFGSIVLSPVYTPFPTEVFSNTLTAEQESCVKETLQEITAAANNIYGSVEAFENSLKEQRTLYKIMLSDMTNKETRAVYGEGKMYAHIFMGYEETGTIFLQKAIEDRIVTYIDPETNKIACASSSAQQVEKFLLNKYQSSLMK